MKYFKELTPVEYGDSAVKILEPVPFGPDVQCIIMHWHDRFELIYVLSGELELWLGDSHFTVPAGQLGVVSPCQPHSGFAGKNGVTYYTVMFELSSFTNGTGASSKYLDPVLERRVTFEPLASKHEIVDSVKKIIALRENTEEADTLLTVSEVYRLCSMLFRFSAVLHDAGFVPDRRFKAVLEDIKENYIENISSKTLSIKYSYDESYFCRRFKSVTGLTPMAYIKILRLEAAREYFDAGERNIADVSQNVGFADSGYFTRCYKRHFGVTPSEYITRL